MGLLLCAGLAAVGGAFWWNRPQPLPPTEIFRGVVYRCEQLAAGPEASGLMHLVRVDLTAPGVSLYITPVDREAEAAGWEYRLRWPSAVAHDEQLAVLVNGPLFVAESSPLPLPGEMARSLDTLVADHEVNHIHEHSYLLWFEDDLTPHLETEKPPPAEALAQARWAVGGQAVQLGEGRVNEFASRVPDRQVMLGIDSAGRQLYLAVFEHASPAAAAEILAQQGATDAISLDGGSSATLVIGAGATGIRPRTLCSPSHGIPTVIGIRALPVSSSSSESRVP